VRAGKEEVRRTSSRFDIMIKKVVYGKQIEISFGEFDR